MSRADYLRGWLDCYGFRGGLPDEEYIEKEKELAELEGKNSCPDTSCCHYDQRADYNCSAGCKSNLMKSVNEIIDRLNKGE